MFSCFIYSIIYVFIYSINSIKQQFPYFTVVQINNRFGTQYFNISSLNLEFMLFFYPHHFYNWQVI